VSLSVTRGELKVPKKRNFVDTLRPGLLIMVFALVPLLLGQQQAKQEGPPTTPPPSPAVLGAKDLSTDILNIAVWPEYDDPRVLAIFRGVFDPSTFKPTQVGFDLPPMAEVIGAGYISEKGELLLHPYQIVPGERGDQLILSLPQNRFFLEYYYQAFGPDPNRAFTYEIPVVYPVKKMEVRVQRPLTSTDFAVEPPASQVFTDRQGFQYHTYRFTDLKPGSNLAFTIRYTKTSPSPSVLRQPAPPVPQAGPPPSPTKEGAFARVQTRYMPYLLGGLVVGGVGLIVLWAMGRVPGIARREPCDNCERMILTSNKFCPHCGGDQVSESSE
jgi:hypothetical protein